MPSDAIKIAAIAASLIIIHTAIIKAHDLSSKALDKAKEAGDVIIEMAATPRAQGKGLDHGAHMHTCQGLSASGGTVSVTFPTFVKPQ